MNYAQTNADTDTDADTGTPTLDTLAAEAWRLTAESPRVLLGLAGPPGAGKSTLARALVGRIAARFGGRASGEGDADGGLRGEQPVDEPAAYLPLDGFHLSNAQLARQGLSARKGSEPSFDVHGYLALLRRVLTETGHDVYVPDFDRTLDEPVAARHRVAPSARLIVTEGNYLACDLPGWREARGLMSAVWYVDAPEEVRQLRLVERQLAGGRTRQGAADWVRTNDRPNGELVAASRGNADRIVSTIGMDMFNAQQ